MSKSLVLVLLLISFTALSQKEYTFNYAVIQDVEAKELVVVDEGNYAGELITLVNSKDDSFFAIAYPTDEGKVNFTLYDRNEKTAFIKTINAIEMDIGKSITLSDSYKWLKKAIPYWGKLKNYTVKENADTKAIALLPKNRKKAKKDGFQKIIIETSDSLTTKYNSSGFKRFHKMLADKRSDADFVTNKYTVNLNGEQYQKVTLKSIIQFDYKVIARKNNY